MKRPKANDMRFGRLWKYYSERILCPHLVTLLGIDSRSVCLNVAINVYGQRLGWDSKLPARLVLLPVNTKRGIAHFNRHIGCL